MALAITITAIDSTPQGGFEITFNVVASGSYVTGGDTLNFSTATPDPLFTGAFAGIPGSGAGPMQLDVWSQNGFVTNPYFPVIGSNITNSKLKILNAYGTSTEVTAGTYAANAAGVLTDKITGFAVFPKWF